MERSLKERRERREEVERLLKALRSEPEEKALEIAEKRLPLHSPEDRARLTVCATVLEQLCGDNEDDPNIDKVVEILSVGHPLQTEISGFEQILDELAGARALFEGVLYSEAFVDKDDLVACSKRAQELSKVLPDSDLFLGAAMAHGDREQKPTSMDELLEIHELEELADLGRDFRKAVDAVANDLEMAASLLVSQIPKNAWGYPLTVSEVPAEALQEDPMQALREGRFAALKDGYPNAPASFGRLEVKSRGRPRPGRKIAAQLSEYLRGLVEPQYDREEYEEVVSPEKRKRNENALKLAAEICNKVLGDTPALDKPLDSQQVWDTHKG